MSFLSMGVINLTPDSFSDGGKYNSPSLVKAHVLGLLSSGVSILDFGAESTAPFNDPIDSSVELSRFKELMIPICREVKDDLPRAISIDTYKGEVFLEVYKKLREFYEGEIIWNDVSGHVDLESIEVLKICSDASYVLSHNLCPDRKKTSFHMDYIVDEDILKNVVSFFKKNTLILKKSLPELKVYLDPCFGFSKTYEQNLDLLNRLSEVTPHFSNDWIIGISKKSFLQKLTKESDKSLAKEKSEYFHALYLAQLIRKLPIKPDYLVRLHDPEVLKMAKSFTDIACK